MKLVVMIPTKNEEDTISEVINEIPRRIEGIDSIEILIMDGASDDRTVEVAKEAGANYVHRDHINRGLAAAFGTGLRLAIEHDADIIVNTDADMQYDQTQIPDLIKPIVSGEADMVLGSRFDGEIEDMSTGKRWGNRLATFVTGKLAGQSISDAQSGFRAFHRELAQHLIVESKKTYVQETLIRAMREGYKVVEIPIRFRKRKGKSRLISSIWRYAFEVFPDLVLTYAQVASFRFFGGMALAALAAGVPFLAAGILHLLIGNLKPGLSLLVPTTTILLPTIATLASAGFIMDYIHKFRMWNIEKEALKNEKTK